MYQMLIEESVKELSYRIPHLLQLHDESIILTSFHRIFYYVNKQTSIIQCALFSRLGKVRKLWKKAVTNLAVELKMNSL